MTLADLLFVPVKLATIAVDVVTLPLHVVVQNYFAKWSSIKRIRATPEVEGDVTSAWVFNPKPATDYGHEFAGCESYTGEGK